MLSVDSIKSKFIYSLTTRVGGERFHVEGGEMREGVKSRIRGVDGGIMNSRKKNKETIVTLKTPITGISEGQAIVFYKKNSSECLGGGIISF